MAEKEERERGKNRARAGSSFGLFKFLLRADFIFCFVVFPIGVFIGWLFDVNPFLTIPLVGVIAAVGFACVRGLRHHR